LGVDSTYEESIVHPQIFVVGQPGLGRVDVFVDGGRGLGCPRGEGESGDRGGDAEPWLWCARIQCWEPVDPEAPPGEHAEHRCCGTHFHWNFGDDGFRKLVLNAIVWAAGMEVPRDGVVTGTPTRAELEANQDFPKPEEKSAGE
jgi:hypothetical protein